MLAALVAGASRPGAQGTADRAMVLRLLRHPAATAAVQERAGREVHIHLGGRLAEALARREGAVARLIEGEATEVRRAAVTLGGPDGGDA